MQAKSFLIFNAVVVAFLVLRLFLGRKLERPTSLDIRSSTNPETKTKTSERILTCPFELQGQHFDAFEVLGVPAGASRDACYRAYIDLKGRGSTSQIIVSEAWNHLEKRFHFS